VEASPRFFRTLASLILASFQIAAGGCSRTAAEPAQASLEAAHVPVDQSPSPEEKAVTELPAIDDEPAKPSAEISGIDDKPEHDRPPSGSETRLPRPPGTGNKPSLRANTNPGEAKRKAKGLLASAKKSASRSRYGQAFREARDAWEMVSGFTEDAECRALAAALIDQMRQYGGKANDGVQPEPFKTLVVE
jgi:hypothetical protein